MTHEHILRSHHTLAGVGMCVTEVFVFNYTYSSTSFFGFSKDLHTLTGTH